MRLWWLGLAGVMACERPPPRTPEASYRTFAEALRRSDARAAWAQLSKPTRTALEARSRAIAQASGGLIKDEPALMVFQSGTRPGPLGEIAVLRSDAGSAVLLVAGSRGPQRVTVVHDGERWLVDLVDAFEREATP
jgi:hypothetical protein